MLAFIFTSTVALDTCGGVQSLYVDKQCCGSEPGLATGIEKGVIINMAVPTSHGSYAASKFLADAQANPVKSNFDACSSSGDITFREPQYNDTIVFKCNPVTRAVEFYYTYKKKGYDKLLQKDGWYAVTNAQGQVHLLTIGLYAQPKSMGDFGNATYQFNIDEYALLDGTTLLPGSETWYDVDFAGLTEHDAIMAGLGRYREALAAFGFDQTLPDSTITPQEYYDTMIAYVDNNAPPSFAVPPDQRDVYNLLGANMRKATITFAPPTPFRIPSFTLVTSPGSGEP